MLCYHYKCGHARCRPFGGYTFTGRVQSYARELLNIIGDEYRDVDVTRAFVAGFDAPLNFWSRNNEVAFRVIEPSRLESRQSVRKIVKF